jgi:uncharacterized protein YndB with AHSA1/START domain
VSAIDAGTRAASTAAADEFVLTRELDAPRELVWRAFTEPERLIHWWGPKGFTVRDCHVDLRPGGHFRYALRSPDGQDLWGRLVYREIAPPERLVFIVSFTDQQGRIARHPWSPSWPLEILSTVTFAERDGRTTLTIRWVPHEASETERQTFAAGRDGIRAGWTGTLDQLAAYLANAKE